MSETIASVNVLPKKLQFVRIPQDALYAPLRPAEKIALGVVWGFSANAMMLTNSQLADILGYSNPETISRMLSRLEKGGWIAIQRVGGARLVRWAKKATDAPTDSPRAQPNDGLSAHQPTDQPTAAPTDQKPVSSPTSAPADACSQTPANSQQDPSTCPSASDDACADQHPFAGVDFPDKPSCPASQEPLTSQSTKKEYKRNKRNLSLKRAEKFSFEMVKKRIAELGYEVDPRQFYAFYRRWPHRAADPADLDRKLTSWHINRRPKPPAADGQPKPTKTIAQLAAEYQTCQTAVAPFADAAGVENR